MKRCLLPVSLLFILCACSSPDLSPSLSSSAIEKVRFNALISCLGDTPLPASLMNESAFTVVDYFGEPASLGNSDLGASKLQDPWCLLTVDVTSSSPDEAFDRLSDVLNTEPGVWLRNLSQESKQYGQDQGVQSFDPDCDDLVEINNEASAALPLNISDLRPMLGVHNPDLTGKGSTIAVFDSGVRQPKKFVAASEVASFSRNFLGHDYPAADPKRHDIVDTFDCSQTPYQDKHGSLVTEIISTLAPGADQIMFKVCDDDGTCPSSSIAKALLLLSNDYENFPRIDIVNMSFGANLTQEDPVLRAILERMTGMNYETLIVTSIGNSAGAAAHYPADYHYLNYGMIPVAAAKKVAQGGAWQLAEFNTQPVLERTKTSLLAAPGVRLRLAQGNPEGVTGTSFAAPVVAAMAAVERQHRPRHNTTAISLHMNLLEHAQPLGEFKFVQFND